MKRSLRSLAVIGLLVLGGLVTVCAEALGRWLDGDIRIQVYAGGLAGVLLGIAGLPFAGKLAGMAGEKDGGASFWKWWGGGMLTRMALILVLALALAAIFKPATAALLAMMGTYLLGMFAESVWLAGLFTKPGPSARENNKNG